VATRVIAMGQTAAGDDGVGFAVLDRLRQDGVPADVELLRAEEDAALVDLLRTRRAVVIVDAVLGTPAGRVVDLAPDDLAARGLTPVSTHGIGVVQAIALARAVAVAADDVAPTIRIVGVTIERPARFEQALSPAVAAAVGAAAARVRACCGG
jgi:hydrogenase maturation protease